MKDEEFFIRALCDIRSEIRDINNILNNILYENK